MRNEFLVNTSSNFAGTNFSSISSDGSGNFVVTWKSGSGLFFPTVRRFASSGHPIGDELVIYDSTIHGYGYPSVSSSAGGQFVVVWETFNTQATPAYVAIVGQRFDSVGV